MKIKTIMTYHFTSIKTSVGKDVEKLKPCALLVGMRNVQPLWETECQFFKKLNIEFVHVFAIPFLGIYLVKVKAGNRTDIYSHTYVHSSIIHNSQNVEETQLSMER